MGLGKGARPPAAVNDAAGEYETVTTVKDNNTGEVKKTIRESGVIGPQPIEGPYIMVGAEHGVTMSVNYQSVTTKCWITKPVAANKAAAMKGMAENWEFIEQEHERRAQWATDVLHTLDDARAKREGR